ncbi:MAG: DedA family protein [Acidimicrobiales bacterium]|nr:DedA family protein [Acidimicrobiales bacterium]
MNVTHLLVSYGYGVVFLFIAIESIGVPLPGETILITAGIYSGTSHKLSVTVIFIVAALGAITGDNIGFWIGDVGGYRLLRKYGHFFAIDETKIKIGRYLFDKHGNRVVFFGRFVSILRTYAAFLAGTNKMRWKQFLFYNAAGGILWAAFYSYASYFVGSSIFSASNYLNLALGVIAVGIVVLFIFVARRKFAQLRDKAEEAYPGPLDG